MVTQEKSRLASAESGRRNLASRSRLRPSRSAHTQKRPIGFFLAGVPPPESRATRIYIATATFRLWHFATLLARAFNVRFRGIPDFDDGDDRCHCRLSVSR